MSKFFTKPKSQEITAPSGYTYVVKPGPRMNRLLAAGRISNPLLAAISEIENREEGADYTPADLATVHQFNAILVAETVIEPRIVAEDTDDPEVISYFDLPEEDVAAIVNYAVTGVLETEPFRTESGASPDSGNAGRAVRKTTKRTS